MSESPSRKTRHRRQTPLDKRGSITPSSLGQNLRDRSPELFKKPLHREHHPITPAAARRSLPSRTKRLRAGRIPKRSAGTDIMRDAIYRGQWVS
jgi:hypothetical protein